MSEKAIRMPQLSDTMTQAKILCWRKSQGDYCKRGDIIAEVETDKANLEIECFDEGYLRSILFEEGSIVNVGEVIALLDSDLPDSKAKPDKLDEKTVKKNVQETMETNSREKGDSFTEPSKYFSIGNSNDSEPSSVSRVKASPLAKKIARESGLDLASVTGSGPNGRVVKRDLDSITQSSRSSKRIDSLSLGTSDELKTDVGARSLTKLQLSRMRSAIAAGMTKSFSEIPHFYLKASVRVDSLVRMREMLKNEDGFEKLTYTHLILKALAKSIKKNPVFNSRLEGDYLVQFDDVDIGLVVGIEDGLIVPIVRAVDKKRLDEIVVEVDSLINKARQKKLSANDLAGGCFAISNLGMYDVEDFSAIIYPGHSGILAVSSISRKPVADDNEVTVA
ncbi:MAG: 2-oxo acid dehydrogenase subunit E2, partial [Deltaproteobacteria bacterium]|nr:2-oxo acid dehydrogenase subunit E2 [Deltaproteobacteria bacterium]